MSSDRTSPARSRRRSAGGCGGARPRPNAPRRRRPTAIAEVKKYFSSNMPRGGRHVLVGGHAADGRFVHADRVGDGLQVQRPQMLRRRLTRKASCWRTISVATFRMVWARWSRLATSQLRRLQAVGEIGLVASRCGPCRDSGVVALVDQHARQGVGVELDLAKPPSGAARTNTSGTTGCTGVGAEGETRLRVELRESRRSCRRGPRRRRRRACARQQGHAWPAVRDCRAAPAWPDRAVALLAAGWPGIP